jgi:uncharacterized membrane protein
MLLALETGLRAISTNWGSYYANHATIRTAIAFIHVGALMAAGGAAVTSDWRLLSAMGRDEPARRAELAAIQPVHSVVTGGIVLLTLSGVLLFAADLDTYLVSRVFWIKMGLLVLLLVNGSILWLAERRVSRGAAAWPTLRVTALVSLALWFLVTLGGVALPNIG